MKISISNNAEDWISQGAKFEVSIFTPDVISYAFEFADEATAWMATKNFWTIAQHYEAALDEAGFEVDDEPTAAPPPLCGQKK